MSAAAADVAWQMIAVRNAEGGRLPTEMAEADVWKHRGKVAGTVVNYRATCHFMRRPGGRSRLAWSATGRIERSADAGERTARNCVGKGRRIFAVKQKNGP